MAFNDIHIFMRSVADEEIVNVKTAFSTGGYEFNSDETVTERMAHC